MAGHPCHRERACLSDGPEGDGAMTHDGIMTGILIPEGGDPRRVELETSDATRWTRR